VGYKPITQAMIGPRLTPAEIEKQKGKPGIVRLTWKTQSEEDNYGYLVKRAKTKDGQYTRINDQILLGAGTSSTENVYVYYDLDVKVGEAYVYEIFEVSLKNEIKSASPQLPLTVNRRYLGPPPAAVIKKSPAGTKAEDTATTQTGKAAPAKAKKGGKTR
jgi:hypothetical protein